MPDKYIEREDEQQEEQQEEQPTPPSYVSKEDFAELKGMVEGLSQSFRSFGETREQPREQPRGPSIDEQTQQLNTQLEQLYDQFDQAVNEGKGASKIQREISKLENAKADLKYGAKIEELQQWGTYAIDQLTDKVVSGSMPLLSIPEVKKAYEDAIKTMAPDQRMNPQVRETAYKFAVGDNMDRIVEFKIQEQLRKGEEEAVTQTPTGKSGRTQEQEGDPNRIPDPSEVLPEEAIKAVRDHPKWQGNFDAYYKSLGYKDWETYWKKTGKAYFRGEEEEEEE
jgi:hypothetical protein